MACGCCCEFVDIFRCEQLPTGGSSAANLWSDGGPLPDVTCDCGLRATEIIAGREWSKYQGKSGDGAISLVAAAGAVRVAVSPVFFRPAEKAVFTVSMLGAAVEAYRSLPFRAQPSYFDSPDEFGLNGTSRLCITAPSSNLAEIGLRVDTAEMISSFGVATWTVTAWSPVFVVGNSSILFGASLSGGFELRELAGLGQITAGGAVTNNAFYHATLPAGFAGNAATTFEVYRDGGLVGTLEKAWNSHYLPSNVQTWTWEYEWQEFNKSEGWVVVQTPGTITFSGDGSPSSPLSFNVILDTPDELDGELGLTKDDVIYPRRAVVAFSVPRPCTVKVQAYSSGELSLPVIVPGSTGGGAVRLLGDNKNTTLYLVTSGTVYLEFQATLVGTVWNGNGAFAITVDVPPTEWYSPEDVSPLFNEDGSYLVVGKITSPSPLPLDDDPYPIVSFCSAVVDQEKPASVIDMDPGEYDDYYANVQVVQPETFTAHATAFSAYMQPAGFGGYGDGVTPFAVPSITRSAHPLGGRPPSELQAIAKFSIDEGLYVGGRKQSFNNYSFGCRFLRRPLDRIEVRFDRRVSGVTASSFSITGNVPPNGGPESLPFTFAPDTADPKRFTLLPDTTAQPWNSQWVVQFTPEDEMLTINEDGSEVEQEQVKSRFMWGVVKDPAVGRRLTDTTSSKFGLYNINTTPTASRDVMRMGYAASITSDGISPVSQDDSSAENRMISFDSEQMYVTDAIGRWSGGLVSENETYVAGAPVDPFAETQTPFSYFGWPYTIWPSPRQPFSNCSTLRSHQKHASSIFGQREILAIDVSRIDGNEVFWQPPSVLRFGVPDLEPGTPNSFYDSELTVARFTSTLNGVPMAQNHWVFADHYVELFLNATRIAMQYAAMETCVLGQLELVIAGNRAVNGSGFPLPYILPRGVITPAMELAFIEGEEIEVGDLVFKAVEFGD